MKTHSHAGLVAPRFVSHFDPSLSPFSSSPSPSPPVIASECGGLVFQGAVGKLSALVLQSPVTALADVVRALPFHGLASSPTLECDAPQVRSTASARRCGRWAATTTLAIRTMVEPSSTCSISSLALFTLYTLSILIRHHRHLSQRTDRRRDHRHGDHGLDHTALYWI